MSLDLTNDKSTLVQVMAWCHQATSHYLTQCWPRSMLPYGINRPQWVNVWDFMFPRITVGQSRLVVIRFLFIEYIELSEQMDVILQMVFWNPNTYSWMTITVLCMTLNIFNDCYLGYLNLKIYSTIIFCHGHILLWYGKKLRSFNNPMGYKILRFHSPEDERKFS